MAKDKKEIPLWARTGHAKPVTRRDFLASGLIPFSASMLLPNWTKLLLPSEAQAAAVNCSVGASDLIPFVTLNLSGGAGLCGNYIATNQGGEMLPSYSIMGLGKAPPVENEFGRVGFAGLNGGQLISKFLQGLRTSAPTALAKTAFVAICVRSRDDSAENRFAADGLVASAGLQGALLPNLGQRPNSLSGIGQEPSTVNPPTPLVVNNFSALTSSLGYAGALGANLKTAQKESLAKLISRLSESQSRKIASIRSGQEIKTLLDCAGVKNEDLVRAGTNVVDPRTDAAAGGMLSTIWGINGGTNGTDKNLIFGSMVYNALKGNAGSVGLEIGGYDYHDGSRATGDSKDLEAGQAAGRILESAAALNKPVFLYVTSDGATSSVNSDAQGAAWTSDRGTAGLAFMLYFNPSGRPETSGSQIGWFNEGQVADETLVTGNSPEAAAAAVFANYLVANKRLDLYQAIAGRTFPGDQLDKVLKFT
jgi:hypothetical protein